MQSCCKLTWLLFQWLLVTDFERSSISARSVVPHSSAPPNICPGIHKSFTWQHMFVQVAPHCRNSGNDFRRLLSISYSDGFLLSRQKPQEHLFPLSICFLFFAVPEFLCIAPQALSLIEIFLRELQQENRIACSICHKWVSVNSHRLHLLLLVSRKERGW